MVVDVLIIYELRTREIENVSLLSAELQKRGYSVRVENIYSPWLYYIEAGVVIVPHLYNDEQLNYFCNNYKHNNKHIISLQYEQVLNDAGEDGIHNPKGEAVKAHHIAWGRAQENRYLKYGIDSSHVHITGCISMDLFRPEFDEYFKSKETIGLEFGLDNKKEWVLFISSFSYAHRTEEELSVYEKMNPKAREFAAISDKSCLLIAEWFEKASEKFPDKEFIYRPHPAEENIIAIKNIEKLHKNFHVISNYSMRQWAHSCDIIYNWFSTSIVDVFYAKKTSYILRPVEIPSNLEVSILKGANFVTTFNEFINSLTDINVKFPIESNSIEYYYGEGMSKMAYIQTIDICEDMLNGVIVPEEFKYEKRNYSIRNVLSRFINGILFLICKYIKLPVWIINLLGPKKKLVKIFTDDVYNISIEYKKYKDRFLSVIN